VPPQHPNSDSVLGTSLEHKNSTFSLPGDFQNTLRVTGGGGSGDVSDVSNGAGSNIASNMSSGIGYCSGLTQKIATTFRILNHLVATS
jgi:hypothetical protein